MKRQRLKARHADDGNPERVAHRLRGRKPDAEPRERARPDAHGNARQLLLFHARHAERLLDVRQQRLRMCQLRLHRDFRREASLFQHRDARNLRRCI